MDATVANVLKKMTNDTLLVEHAKYLMKVQA